MKDRVDVRYIAVTDSHLDMELCASEECLGLQSCAELQTTKWESRVLKLNCKDYVIYKLWGLENWRFHITVLDLRWRLQVSKNVKRDVKQNLGSTVPDVSTNEGPSRCQVEGADVQRMMLNLSEVISRDESIHVGCGVARGSNGKIWSCCVWMGVTFGRFSSCSDTNSMIFQNISLFSCCNLYDDIILNRKKVC